MSSIRNISKSVCIFGGGVVGLNTAIQLADLGIKVFIVDNQPFFGGNAAHLYKAYPTNDCFFCLLSTGYKAGIRKCFYRSGINFHPNINLFRNTKLISFSGEYGNFKLKLKSYPTYINQNCTNCGNCIKVCPKIENFEDVFYKKPNLPIISNNYPQCISNYFLIDRNMCKSDCNICEDECPANAINLKEKEKEIDIECANIIISSGFQEFNPEIIKNYRYGVIKDVITQNELALMLDPNGSTNGKLFRPSDNNPIETMVMLQCVGSRDENYNKYCSNICCDYAIKHATIIKENINPAPSIYIVYIDIRTMGFLERYYTEAREKDVIFIKGNLTDVEIIKDEKSGLKKLNLKIYDALLNSILIIPSDLLVLSTGIIPSKSGIKLCNQLKLELNNEGFVKVKEDSLSTNINGIYACGTIIKPMDLASSSNLTKSLVFKIFTTTTKDGGEL